MYKKRLIDLKESQNKKQIELSELLKLDKDVYGHYEREETIIPIKHLIFIANYYNVSVDFIYNFTDKRQYENNRNEINRDLTKERLKNLRIENNIHQRNFANSVGVSKSTISGYERKINTISTTCLYYICKKYNISADYLLGKTDYPKYLK